jgi:5-methylcytosine-specific restriction endonuclease McrA
MDLYQVAYRAEHKKQTREYRKNHRSEFAAYASSRRALKMGAMIGATASQLAEIKEIYRRAKDDGTVRCYLCGRLVPLGERHVDHIMPLSKGGKHRPSNLAIACATCNRVKNAKLPEEVGVLL